MKRCWAKNLGGCSAKITREHYIGHELLHKVKVRGLHPDLERRELPVSAPTAHILCEIHNNKLSEVDQEAIKLKDGLIRWFKQEEDVCKGKGFWTPTRIDINGSLFGRWLCKVHCNFRTIDNTIPAEYYVRSAFGEATSPAARFYVQLDPGEILSYERRIWYADYFIGWSKPDEYALFHVYFMGLHFLVCPFELTANIQATLAAKSHAQSYRGNWTETPKRFVWKQGDIETKFLVFDW